MTDASVTLQTYLDEIALAVMRQDFATYRQGVSLPFQLVTHNASLHIVDEAQLRQGFETFAMSLRAQRVTDFVRLVEGADQIDPTLITGRYVTHLLSGALRIIPPFHSQITLRHEGGRWMAASITNALANARWPLITPVVAPTDDAKGLLQ